MTTFGVVWLAVFSLGFGVCGWLCVFKTEMLVESGRRSYQKRKVLEEKSRLVRALVGTNPTSRMVLKPWYPTFIRCMGAFIWLWALAVLCLVIFDHFR